MDTFIGTFFQVLFSRYFFPGSSLQVLFVGTFPRYKNSEACGPGE